MYRARGHLESILLRAGLVVILQFYMQCVNRF